MLSTFLLGASPDVVTWEILEPAVRDGRTPQPAAQQQLVDIVRKLSREKPIAMKHSWTFPIAGGTTSWIGGKSGEGFHPETPQPTYSWYDGNRHGGHPAHDIFIPDRNHDNLHDHTDQPFYAVAMQPAVVISTNERWEPGKPRGGKYVWLYNNTLELFFYYAHLNDILVTPGQQVQAGERLGTVGRTGFPVRNRQKPAHLHLMALQYQEGKMIPYNYFSHLNNHY